MEAKGDERCGLDGQEGEDKLARPGMAPGDPNLWGHVTVQVHEPAGTEVGVEDIEGGVGNP